VGNIRVAQDRVKWRTHLKSAMTVQVPQKATNILNINELEQYIPTIFHNLYEIRRSLTKSGMLITRHYQICNRHSYFDAVYFFSKAMNVHTAYCPIKNNYVI
jgi:hypothetical protein